MKRKINLFFTLIMILCLCFGSTVYAYDDSDYDTVDGYIVLDDTHGHEQHLYLYVLTENNLNYTTFISYYQCSVQDESKPSGYRQLLVRIYCPEMTIVGELDGCNIYEVRVGIEPGVYAFSQPGGINGAWTSALTQGFYSPYINCGFYKDGDGMNGIKELTTVGEGQIATVYALYGEDDWRHDNERVQAFADWAREYDAAFADKDEHLVVSEMSESNSPVQIQTVTEEVEEKEEFVPAEGPTRVTESTVTVVEPVVEEPENEITTLSIVRMVCGLGLMPCILAIAGAVSAYIKRRNQ